MKAKPSFFIYRLGDVLVSPWQEGTAGDIVPVLFATDNQGNIYVTTPGAAPDEAPGGLSNYFPSLVNYPPFHLLLNRHDPLITTKGESL